MADGEAQVAADDRVAEQVARGAVGGGVRWPRTISAGSSIASRIAAASVVGSAMALSLTAMRADALGACSR